MLVKSQVKYIQSLGQKKPRDEAGLFVAEGPKIVEELLAIAASRVDHVYALGDWIQENKPLLGKIPATELALFELQKISQLATPNQVLALVKQASPMVALQTKDRWTLVLDTIQDPGNLGTIIRIADWFGIGQIVCSHGSADCYSSKVVQSTMASIMRVQVIYTDLHEWLQQQQVPVYAAALDGKDMYSMDKHREGIIVIGNESKGISPELMHLVSEKITIPRRGEAESLNAAVATGIIVSHLVS